jgi:threonine/homoserine/homoserine lactone efflux protein
MIFSEVAVISTTTLLIFLFLKGSALGLAMSAPVGPVNLLCMRRAATRGRRYGILTGIGAASADTIYGGIAALGVTWVSDFLRFYEGVFQIVGSILFLLMAYSLWNSRVPSQVDDDPRARNDLNMIVTTFIITLSNPTTVFAYLTAFAALGFGSSVRSMSEATVVTAGVFIGSMLWWYILSWSASRLKKRLNAKAIERINVITAILLVAFAAFLLTSGIIHFNERHS